MTYIHFVMLWSGSGDRFTTWFRNPRISVPGFTYGGLLASIVDCHAMATAAAAAEQAAGRKIVRATNA